MTEIHNHTQPHHVHHEKKHQKGLHPKILIGFLIVFFLLLVGLAVLRGKKQTQQEGKEQKQEEVSVEGEKKIVPTVTPYIPPIAPGKQLYYIQTKEKPILQNVTFDPLDAKEGREQKVLVGVQNDTDVDSITVTFMKDGKSFPMELKLVSGTAKSGNWEGAWKAQGTYNIDYRAIIEAKSGKDMSKVDVTFR